MHLRRILICLLLPVLLCGCGAGADRADSPTPTPIQETSGDCPVCYDPFFFSSEEEWLEAVWYTKSLALTEEADPVLQKNTDSRYAMYRFDQIDTLYRPTNAMAAFPLEEISARESYVTYWLARPGREGITITWERSDYAYTNDLLDMALDGRGNIHAALREQDGIQYAITTWGDSAAPESLRYTFAWRQHGQTFTAHFPNMGLPLEGYLALCRMEAIPYRDLVDSETAMILDKAVARYFPPTPTPTVAYATSYSTQEDWLQAILAARESAAERSPSLEEPHILSPFEESALALTTLYRPGRFLERYPLQRIEMNAKDILYSFTDEKGDALLILYPLYDPAYTSPWEYVDDQGAYVGLEAVNHNGIAYDVAGRGDKEQQELHNIVISWE